MEAIREGVDDYEYHVMWRDRIDATRKANSDRRVLTCARELLAQAAKRVCGPEGVDLLMWADAKDRTIADRVKVEVLEMLLRYREPC